MKKKPTKKIIEMNNNNDYKTGNLLDFGLSKQTKLKDPRQISFIGKLSNTRGGTMFFIIEKSVETTFNFSQNSVTII